jgi:succinate dehydrogenase hydrophobic anchor subunit
MNRSEKALVVLLRASAVLLLTAVIPAVMPFAWMKDIHRQLAMGELPEGPIIGYLTRSLSAMYAIHGAILLFVSLDVRRYLPVVKFLAVLCVVFGIGMIVLDVIVGMPMSWVLGEGPFIVALGGIMLWLAGRAEI